MTAPNTRPADPTDDAIRSRTQRACSGMLMGPLSAGLGSSVGRDRLNCTIPPTRPKRKVYRGKPFSSTP